MAELAILGAVLSGIQVVKKTADYVTSIRDAPLCVQLLSDDMRALQTCLETLRRRVTDPDFARNPSADQIKILVQPSVENCSRSCSRLNKLIQPYVRSAPESNGTFKWKTLTFGFREKEIRAVQSELSSCKGTLQVAVDLSSFMIQQVTSKQIDRIHRRVDRIQIALRLDELSEASSVYDGAGNLMDNARQRITEWMDHSSITAIGTDTTEKDSNSSEAGKPELDGEHPAPSQIVQSYTQQPQILNSIFGKIPEGIEIVSEAVSDGGTFVIRWPYPANSVSVETTLNNFALSLDLRKVGDAFEREVWVPFGVGPASYTFDINFHEQKGVIDPDAPQMAIWRSRTNYYIANTILPHQIQGRRSCRISKPIAKPDVFVLGPPVDLDKVIKVLPLFQPDLHPQVQAYPPGPWRVALNKPLMTYSGF